MTPDQKVQKLKEIREKTLENRKICAQAFGESSDNPNEALEALCIAANRKVFDADVKKVLEN